MGVSDESDGEDWFASHVKVKARAGGIAGDNEGREGRGTSQEAVVGI